MFGRTSTRILRCFLGFMALSVNCEFVWFSLVPEVDYSADKGIHRKRNSKLFSTLILGSCLRVDPSPHNFNLDVLLLLLLLPSSHSPHLTIQLIIYTKEMFQMQFEFSGQTSPIFYFSVPYISTYFLYVECQNYDFLLMSMQLILWKFIFFRI